MEEAQKKQLKSMISGSLLGLIVIGCFFYLISSIGFKLFEDDPIELGTFKLKTGKTFELKSYYGNAISSSVLDINEINNVNSEFGSAIRLEEPYLEFIEWRQINDSLLQLILENSKEKDTIYVLLQKEEITLEYEPIHKD